jgi:hypothetical protein
MVYFHGCPTPFSQNGVFSQATCPFWNLKIGIVSWATSSFRNWSILTGDLFFFKFKNQSGFTGDLPFQKLVWFHGRPPLSKTGLVSWAIYSFWNSKTSEFSWATCPLFRKWFIFMGDLPFQKLVYFHERPLFSKNSLFLRVTYPFRFIKILLDFIEDIFLKKSKPFM